MRYVVFVALALQGASCMAQTKAWPEATERARELLASLPAP
jgi:hypothetical protein